MSEHGAEDLPQAAVEQRQTDRRSLLPQPYATLLPPLGAGATAFVVWLLCDPGRSPDWPLGAATILAALIIAATLEGSLFLTRKLWDRDDWQRRVTRGLTNALWYWPVLALLWAGFRATGHHAFSRIDGALVAGGIATLLVTVGNLASLRATPDWTLNENGLRSRDVSERDKGQPA